MRLRLLFALLLFCAFEARQDSLQNSDCNAIQIIAKNCEWEHEKKVGRDLYASRWAFVRFSFHFRLDVAHISMFLCGPWPRIIILPFSFQLPVSVSSSFFLLFLLNFSCFHNHFDANSHSSFIVDFPIIYFLCSVLYKIVATNRK